MPFQQIMFGFQGRLARLPYFGYSLLLVVPVAIPGVVGLSLILSGGERLSFMVFGLFFIAVAAIILIWGSLALTIKRLHDLGLADAHAIWIYGIGIAGGPLENTAPALSFLLGFTSLGLGIWLLFTPGQSTTNRYGPPPGSPTEEEVAATFR